MNDRLREYFSILLSADSQFLIVLAVDKIMRILPVLYGCVIKTQILIIRFIYYRFPGHSGVGNI